MSNKGVVFILALLVLAVGCTRWADVPQPLIPRVVGVYTVDGFLIETREVHVPDKAGNPQQRIVLEVPQGVEIPERLVLKSPQGGESELGGLPQLTWGQPTPTATTRAPVPPNPDVNGDGQVNIFDLTAVGGLYGQPDGLADVNGDGTVNIFDLTAVGGAYGAGETEKTATPRTIERKGSGGPQP